MFLKLLIRSWPPQLSPFASAPSTSFPRFGPVLYTSERLTCPRITRVMRVLTKIIPDKMGELSYTKIAPSGTRGDAVGSAVTEEWGPFRCRSWRSCRQNDLGTPLPCECCGSRQAIRTLLETPSCDAFEEHRRRRPARHQVCHIACCVNPGRFYW